MALYDAFLSIRSLLRLLTGICMNSAYLPPRSIAYSVRRFPFLTLLLFLAKFLTLMRVRPHFLIPYGRRREGIRQTSIPCFRDFCRQLNKFFIFLCQGSYDHLALRLAARVSPWLRTIQGRIRRAGGANIMSAHRPVGFVCRHRTFDFVINALGRIYSTIGSSRLSAAMLMMRFVRTLCCNIWTFLA